MSRIQAYKDKIHQMAQYQVMPEDRYTLEDKIEELKADPKYSGWTETEIEEYAASLLLTGNARSYGIYMNSIYDKSGKPMDTEWSQYSYEEILQMEDNGVLIPDDFLEWAHSMQSSNVAEYELDTGDVQDTNDVEGTKSDVGEAGNMGLTNVAKVLTKKVVLQEETLNEAVKEFERYSADMDSMTNEALAVQNNALQQIQEMMNEWQSIDNKVKNGEELSADEQARYGELGLMMENVVTNSTMQVSNFTSDFDEISSLMNSTSEEAKIAQDYANETSFTGDLIAQYETSQQGKSVTGNNHIFTGATGTVALVKANALGKNLAVSSIKQSGYLQNTTFDTDESIKKISAQINNMTADVNAGDRNISQIISEGINSTDSAQTTPQPQAEETPTAPVEPVEIPGEEPAQNTPPLPPRDDNEQNDNVFAEQEDFNNINTILKRQQKDPPKMQPQDIIIDT